MMSIDESSNFSNTIRKVRPKLFIMFLEKVYFIRFRISLVFNPKIGRDFESTTINETSKWSFLCFRVSEHFPGMGILELLYVDNFMSFGQRSCSESSIFKIGKGIIIH